jgi:hypothetical protein
MENAHDIAFNHENQVIATTFFDFGTIFGEPTCWGKWAWVRFSSSPVAC